MVAMSSMPTVFIVTAMRVMSSVTVDRVRIMAGVVLLAVMAMVRTGVLD